MQLQTVLCYSYTYDMIFITKFLKSNVGSAIPSEIFWVDSWYIAIHRYISLQTGLRNIDYGINGT
jgi:hypothetical protein